jgi:hypothetical protein
MGDEVELCFKGKFPLGVVNMTVNSELGSRTFRNLSRLSKLIKEVEPAVATDKAPYAALEAASKSPGDATKKYGLP